MTERGEGGSTWNTFPSSILYKKGWEEMKEEEEFRESNLGQGEKTGWPIKPKKSQSRLFEL